MHLRATPFLGPLGRLGKDGQEIPLGKQVSQRKKIGRFQVLWNPDIFFGFPLHSFITMSTLKLGALLVRYGGNAQSYIEHYESAQL